MSKTTEFIFKKIQDKALGNSDRKFKNVASDLLNALGEKPSKIADGTFLSVATVERVMKCEDEYRPQSETLERIFRYCNAEVSFSHTKIKPEFSNKPKEPV